MTHNVCSGRVSRTSSIIGLIAAERAEAAARWHPCNPTIIINNSREVAGSAAGGYERMGTMDYTACRLSCKLHEGDKAPKSQYNKKKRRVREGRKKNGRLTRRQFSASGDGRDKAGSLNRRRLQAHCEHLTAVTVTTKRKRCEWLNNGGASRQGFGIVLRPTTSPVSMMDCLLCASQKERSARGETRPPANPRWWQCVAHKLDNELGSICGLRGDATCKITDPTGSTSTLSNIARSTPTSSSRHLPVMKFKEALGFGLNF